jgi:Holliday junction DNA helicase RuvB
MNAVYRPTELNSFIGKENIKNNIRTFINSALKHNKPLDHVLIYGLPGTGKTTLAGIIAHEMKKKIKIVQGNCLQKPADVINIVLSLCDNDILFIDEIHAVNPMCVELLYSVMEDFVIDVALGKDFNTKVTRITIPSFTLIGATTIYGRIPLPLEERFGIILNIKMYSDESIIKILENYCSKNNLKLADSELKQIANNSKGIPRLAIRIIKRVGDFRICDSNISINDIFKNMEINQNGLDQNDIEYLKILSETKPLGLKTISQIANIDIETIETKIEPYLLNKNYIHKTSTGRVITSEGIKQISQINS